MHTKIWSQNLKRKIACETRLHIHENNTELDFKGMACEYSRVEGSVRREAAKW